VPLVQAAPDVQREIAGLVHRAMAANPDLRFATATEMRLALEKASGGIRSDQAGVQPGLAAPAPASVRAPEMGRTGTIAGAMPVGAMSQAPSARVPTPAPFGPGAEVEGPRTERAPPIATALTPQAPLYGAGMAVPPAPYIDPRARRGGGARLAALIALPVLIGAGVVMVLVATGAWPSNSAGGEPALTPPQQSPPAVATVDTTPTATQSPPTTPPLVPTLTPTRTIPVATGTAHPPGSGRVLPKGADAGAAPMGGPPSAAPPGDAPPPFMIPSALPFPTAIPGLPPIFPSGMVPPWPAPGGGGGAPAPAPAPSPHGNSGSI
jgi:hypothetical protein